MMTAGRTERRDYHVCPSCHKQFKIAVVNNPHCATCMRKKMEK